MPMLIAESWHKIGYRVEPIKLKVGRIRGEQLVEYII